MREDPNYMSNGLWIATIGCVCLAILFAVFAAVFALVNTATTPVEAITGIPGLYLWNICARKSIRQSQFFGRLKCDLVYLRLAKLDSCCS